MQRSTGLELMRRALDILEQGRPELADRYMHVPLDYYKDPGLDDRERGNRNRSGERRVREHRSHISGPAVKGRSRTVRSTFHTARRAFRRCRNRC